MQLLPTAHLSPGSSHALNPIGDPDIFDLSEMETPALIFTAEGVSDQVTAHTPFPQIHPYLCVTIHLTIKMISILK